LVRSKRRIPAALQAFLKLCVAGIAFAKTRQRAMTTARHTILTMMAAASSLLVATTAVTARAEEPAAASAPGREITTTQTRPSRTMLRSGVFLLGVPYVSSIVVAATSDHKGDQHLYVPVAGPWMDLSDRSCQPAQVCKNEGLYKGLLIANGVFQGVGALEIVGAFLFPETVTSKTNVGGWGYQRGAPFRIAPASVGAGYGLVALGKF
jgi:hypothetical protein